MYRKDEETNLYKHLNFYEGKKHCVYVKDIKSLKTSLYTTVIV